MYRLCAKTVESALRKLKKKTDLGRKGQLTNAMIDHLQNYYRIAIRSNHEDKEKMKKAIHGAATFRIALTFELLLLYFMYRPMNSYRAGRTFFDKCFAAQSPKPLVLLAHHFLKFHHV